MHLDPFLFCFELEWLGFANLLTDTQKHDYFCLSLDGSSFICPTHLPICDQYLYKLVEFIYNKKIKNRVFLYDCSKAS